MGVGPTYVLIAFMYFCSRSPSLRTSPKERVTEGNAWCPWESRVGSLPHSSEYGSWEGAAQAAPSGEGADPSALNRQWLSSLLSARTCHWNGKLKHS